MPDQTAPLAQDRVDKAVRSTNRIMTIVLRWISKHWLLVANVCIGSLIVLPVLAPVFMQLGLTGLGNLIYLLFKPACHQLPQRSFFLFGPQVIYTESQLGAMIGGAVTRSYVGAPGFGYKIAVCERDVAIYGSMLLTGLLFGLFRKLKTLPLKVFGALVLPMLVDGFGQLFGFWSSTWQSRVITGGLFGIACIWLAYPYLQQGMRDIYQETLNLLQEMAPLIMPENVSIIAAFAAGLLSFFSPCVLPLVPIYLGYMTGTAATNLGTSNRLRLLIHALLFVLGFGIIFVLLGAVMGLLGGLIGRILPILIRVGGLLLIVLGLSLCGLISIPFLQMDMHLNVDNRRAKGYWTSFVVGIVFAAGWTPCIGPVLASILFLAASSQTMLSGALLLSVYSLGLGLPFLAAGGLINLAIPLIRRMGRWSRIFNYIGGGLLIVMGLLLTTGLFSQITSWFNAIPAGY